MPSILITLTPNLIPTPPPLPFLHTYVRARISIMYLDFARFLWLLSRVSFEMRESIYSSCVKYLIITTRMFVSAYEAPKKYQVSQTWETRRLMKSTPKEWNIHYIHSSENKLKWIKMDFQKYGFMNESLNKNRMNLFQSWMHFYSFIEIA